MVAYFMACLLCVPLGEAAAFICKAISERHRQAIEEVGYEVTAMTRVWRCFFSAYMLAAVSAAFGVNVSLGAAAGFATFLFLAMLLVIGYIDMRYTYIFDEENIALLAFGVVWLLAAGGPLLAHLKAGGITFAIAFALFAVSCRLTGSCIFGGGDVKLLGALGVWLGGYGILRCFMIAAVLGGIAGICYIAARRKGGDLIPYGPYICIGAAYVWLAETVNIIRW